VAISSVENNPPKRDGVRPLSEMILVSLGRPRMLWRVAWSAVALISPFAFATGAVTSGRPLGSEALTNLLLTQAAIAYACFVLLMGTGMLARRAEALAQELVELDPDGGHMDLFGRSNSRAGPILLTAAVAAIVSAGGTMTYGAPGPLASLPFLFVYLVPILTYVWVYVTILLDLNRLGRHPLTLTGFPQDRTLGLRSVGVLASAGLGFLLIAAAPVLIAAGDEPVTLAIGLAIIGIALASFVASMWPLHQQMAAAKERYVATTRRLYAEAYAPMAADASQAALEAQSGALGAARSLDERAQSLQTWPIDEGTLRFVTVIVTGVVTSLVVRAVFAALGV
jgi:hypothetical protein